MANSTIAAGVCERLITAATAHCAAPPQVLAAPAPQVIKEPNWEGVTTSLTALSTALAWGLFVIAVVTLLGLIAWGVFVKKWARDAAQETAQQWLNTEGIRILREAKSLLNPDDGGLDAQAAQQGADEIGKNAG